MTQKLAIEKKKLSWKSGFSTYTFWLNNKQL